jgi:hypothetical protein
MLLEQEKTMSSIRRPSHAVAFLLISLVLAGTAVAQIITTVAGGALPATPLPGVAASIHPPGGIAADAVGNVYLSNGDVVFKLDATGTLTRVAGTGTSGYSGDGGPATSAQLDASGVAVDASGNLYIADADNNRIRLVTAQGSRAVLGLTLTHSGNFKAGQNGAYAVIVRILCAVDRRIGD